MPVDTPHPLYSLNLPTWKRCRDAYEGEDAVKNGGTNYLPRMSARQPSAEYEAYKLRAAYYEAVGRTVDGFVGAIARKNHTFKLPGSCAELVDDVTGDGMGLAEFVKSLASETLLAGRTGLLVDYDEAKARPIVAYYPTEAILNWSADLVVLAETVYEQDPADPFVNVAVAQIRQLSLVDGAYTVTLWRKPSSATPATPDKPKWSVYASTTPTARGVTLDFIPWFWCSCLGQTDRIPKPPLLGLVNVALSHYRSSADLEHGRHFAGRPTLYVTGMRSDQEIRVGGAAAIIIPDPAARVGYAEFTGQGLGSLETALESKEKQMAVLGAAVFAQSKAGVEAAETARIRTSGETSLLAGVVSAVQETLKAALECACRWQAQTGEVTVELNREFMDSPMDAQTLAGLVAAYVAGTITLETFLFSLDQADMLPPTTDIAQEATRLRAEAEANRQRLEQQTRQGAGAAADPA